MKRDSILKHGGQIARLKNDMTDTAQPFRELSAANYPLIKVEESIRSFETIYQ
jgi:hypothetical protein